MMNSAGLSSARSRRKTKKNSSCSLDCSSLVCRSNWWLYSKKKRKIFFVESVIALNRLAEIPSDNSAIDRSSENRSRGELSKALTTYGKFKGNLQSILLLEAISSRDGRVHQRHSNHPLRWENTSRVDPGEETVSVRRCQNEEACKVEIKKQRDMRALVEEVTTAEVRINPAIPVRNSRMRTKERNINGERNVGPATEIRKLSHSTRTEENRGKKGRNERYA